MRLNNALADGIDNNDRERFVKRWWRLEVLSFSDAECMTFR